LATHKKRARQVVRKTRKELELPSPPAYFLSVTIENIRAFRSAQTLDLSDRQGRPARWTVILGDNGVGKTTLLQSIARCEAVETAAYHPAGGGNFLEQPIWIPLSIAAFSFNKILNRSSTAEADGSFVQLTASLLRGVSLASPEQGRVIDNWGIQGRIPLRGESPFMTPLEEWMTEDVGGLVCYGYGATRRMGTSSLADALNQENAASLFYDHVSLLNAEEWLLQADYAALVDSPDQEQARRRRDQVRNVLIDLLPDVSDIRFIRPTSSTSQSGIEVQTPYGWVTINELSLGYRTLIAWVVDLAYRLFERYPDSPNPLAEPAIVLVDEIDLHLHPRWQRTIMAYLTERFPNTQFIVTAHSPLIVQAATDANIVLLRREGDHVVIDNDVEAIRGWRIDQVLTSDLFGLETARPPEYDEALAERNRILGKSRLTKKDEQRLEELDARIGDLPTGETPQDMEAMDVIRRAAEVLKRERADLR
jgi:energy-coupling factor transporter ATP-binding protein EcfA2